MSKPYRVVVSEQQARARERAANSRAGRARLDKLATQHRVPSFTPIDTSVEKPKLLLPPGIGDIHWVMLKMQSFIEKYLNGRKPEIWVCSPDGSMDRAAEYVQRVPFVTFGGYFNISANIRLFLDVAVNGAILKNWSGFDYFFGMNKEIGLGKPLSEIWPELASDHDYPIIVTEQDKAEVEALKLPEPFVLTSFYSRSFYVAWDKVLSGKLVIKKLVADGKVNVAMTGAPWDLSLGDAYFKGLPAINIVGRTSLGCLLALFHKAAAFVGHAAGNGMIAQHMGCPTVLLWGADFHKGMRTNFVEPSKIGGVYRVIDITRSDANIVAEEVYRACR
jgi:hypothetical protein